MTRSIGAQTGENGKVCYCATATLLLSPDVSRAVLCLHNSKCCIQEQEQEHGIFGDKGSGADFRTTAKHEIR